MRGYRQFFFGLYLPNANAYVLLELYLRIKKDNCQAQPQLNSTQPQLKLRLRLALMPPDPATHHPPTTHHPPGTVDFTLHDYSRQIQGCFKTKLLLLLRNFKTTSLPSLASTQLNFNSN